MNIILAIIAFNLIVIIHELGHFIAAKLFGIKVLEFSLFIGPKLFGIKRGETEYSLRLFPIMAYVKMEGEEEASDSMRAYRNKPRYVRAIVLAAAPIANLVLAIVILTGVFSVTGFSTVEVASVEQGKAAYTAGIRPGDRIVSYNGNRTYLPMEVIQFLYISNGKPANIGIIREGNRLETNIEPQLIPQHVKYRLGITVRGATGPDSNVVNDVVRGGPAEKTGLLPGDRIVKLNDTEISDKQDIDSYLEQNGAKPLSVTALRNGSEVTLNLTPMAENIPEQYDLGLVFAYKKGGIAEVFSHSLLYTVSVVRSVGLSLIWLITGKASLNQVMGPVGIVSTISSAVGQGPTVLMQLIYLLQMTALFSIAVGATQFIPFPMMDGNKLFLILIEAVRGKPIPPEKEAFISMIGFAILVVFAIYAFYNDILRIMGGG